MANESTAMSLYQIIGAPLHALVEAEAQAAMKTAEVIQKIGFHPPEVHQGDNASNQSHDEFGALRYVKFLKSSTNSEGETEQTEISVPMLSMLPIPALQIRHADLDFSIKIVETNVMGAEKLPPHIPPEQNRKNEQQPDEPVAEKGPELIDFKAALGRDGGSAPGNRRMDTQIKMKIRMEQADLPNGLAKMLNLLGENVTTKPVPRLND